MSKPRWQADEHPSADLLLLNLEGELDAKEAAGVEEHLKHCWSCRAQSERMQRSICSFVEHRDARVLPNLPSPPSSSPVFLVRLRQVAIEQEPISPIRQAMTNLVRRCSSAVHDTWNEHRPRVLSALVATGMALLLVILPVVNPPAISAAVFLERARVSREAVLRQMPRVGIYQRVEIRHAGRAITRELLHGLPKQSRFQSASNHADFENLFRRVGFNWDDPLNVQSFSDWRDALVQKDDTIRTTDSRVTLTTRADIGSPVAEASLTVRQADWHPVAERIQLRGVEAPVEVTELAFEVREFRPALETRVSEAPRVAVPGVHEPVVPSEEDLQIAEADFREALHKAGADVQEAPQVWREGNQIRFYILTDRPERKFEILRFVEAIPYVSESPQMQPTHASTIRQSPSAPLRTVDPPFAKVLEDRFGRIDLMTQYLDRVHNTYLKLVAEASALDRLATRYTAPALSMLPKRAREQVTRIAAEHVAQLRHEGADYIALVSPVLDEMLQRTGVLGEAALAEHNKGCGNWQAEAAALVERLRQFQEPFSRLFVRHEVEEEVTPTAEDLLRSASASRAAIVNAMQTLCSPE